MLYTAFALFVLAIACAVVLFGQKAEPPILFVADAEGAAASDAWRAAALDAHGDVKRLRRGIASALDVHDHHEREAILRDALADTWRPEGIRITL